MAIVTKRETITPGQAKRILTENNGRNRPLSQSHANRMAKLITDGDFKLTHQGIAFNCDGTLIDGQHRLWAVVISGIATEFMVTRGLPADARDSIDLGRKRDARDVIFFDDEKVGDMEIATARMMFAQGEISVANTMTIPDVKRYLYQHWDAIVFATTGAKSRGYPAAARAAIARAWYSVDRDRLGQFKECYLSGIAPCLADGVAVRLKNLILSSPGLTRLSIYRRTENTIAKFIAREPVTVIKEITKELFPVPGDDEDDDDSAPLLPRAKR